MTFLHAAITISDDYDPLTDAALGNPNDTADDEPTARRGRDREDSPDGDDRGRDRREVKGGGHGDRSRSRSPRRDAANGSHATATAGNTTVVKCRGLPYSASEKDIRDFFEGCVIERDGMFLASLTLECQHVIRK